MTAKNYSKKIIADALRRGLHLNQNLIEKACDFAFDAHFGQKRLSGEDYIIHPVEVARILIEWDMDTESIVAGLLHDTIEDGGAKREDIVGLFGENIAVLVDGVTNVATLKLRGNNEERFLENLRKMVLFMAKDIRVVVVKLADRLHNMRTLSYLSELKQHQISKETLEVYAPLAERLGMGEVKGELDDLGFKYFYPKDWEKLLQDSKVFYKKAENQIEDMKKILLKKLVASGVVAQIGGRKKHYYSLFSKLKRPEIDGDFSKISDIVALRIILKTIPDCYTALGVVHNSFKPVPKIGISDFIAQPKPNGYQSIHTKVFGPHGGIVEVQIRTAQMHEQAEHGIAAHWAYAQAKETGVSGNKLEKGVKVEKEKLNWVKQLVAWQDEIVDSKEFFESVKFDVFNQRNFIFSPHGDVYDLPKGATPVDFAYAVHTKLANYIQGAKVDGKIVPLDHKLTSGNVVEIIKSKNPHKPNPDWISFVVTTAAKREILKQTRKSD